MDIILNRLPNQGTEGTNGVLIYDDRYCFILEDGFKETKVAGETRIPAGTYDVKFRKVESGMTIKYRKKFPWFTWHLELQDVPGFKYVYIHIGNRVSDTEGCILVGSSILYKSGKLLDSTIAYKKFYEKISQEIECGVTITITD